MADPAKPAKPAKPSTVGYSGRTLGQKMGLDKGALRLGTVRAPVEYPHWLSDVWEPLRVTQVSAAKKLKPVSYDVVHMFTYDRSQLDADITAAISACSDSKGALWISWPKKTSKLFVDVTEDTLREVILPTGWVDVKVAAVSDQWSGLKFLRRKTDHT
jgi:hypothetical protein